MVQAEEGARGKGAPGPGPACRQDRLTSLPDATTCPPQRAGRAVRNSKPHPCSACPPKPWEEPQQVTREGPVPHSPLWGSGALLRKRQAAEPSLSHTGPRQALCSPTCPSRDSTCGQAPKAEECSASAACGPCSAELPQGRRAAGTLGRLCSQVTSCWFLGSVMGSRFTVATGGSEDPLLAWQRAVGGGLAEPYSSVCLLDSGEWRGGPRIRHPKREGQGEWNREERVSPLRRDKIWRQRGGDQGGGTETQGATGTPPSQRGSRDPGVRDM